MPSDFLGRDDLEKEMMEELEVELSEILPPDYILKYYGDVTEQDISPEALAKTDQLFAAMRDSMEKGQCFECESCISDDFVKGEQIPADWSEYDAGGGNSFLICPICEDIISQESIHIEEV